MDGGRPRRGSGTTCGQVGAAVSMPDDRDTWLLELETRELEDPKEGTAIQSEPYCIGLQERTIAWNRETGVPQFDRWGEQIVVECFRLDEYSEVLRDARAYPVENAGPNDCRIHGGNHQQHERDHRRHRQKCEADKSRPQGPHRDRSLT